MLLLKLHKNPSKRTGRKFEKMFRMAVICVMGLWVTVIVLFIFIIFHDGHVLTLKLKTRFTYLYTKFQ